VQDYQNLLIFTIWAFKSYRYKRIYYSVIME
jgi:hypothetical protein